MKGKNRAGELQESSQTFIARLIDHVFLSFLLSRKSKYPTFKWLNWFLIVFKPWLSFSIPLCPSTATTRLSLLVHLSGCLFLQFLICSHSVSLRKWLNVVKLASVDTRMHKGPLTGQRMTMEHMKNETDAASVVSLQTLYTVMYPVLNQVRNTPFCRSDEKQKAGFVYVRQKREWHLFWQIFRFRRGRL